LVRSEFSYEEKNDVNNETNLTLQTIPKSQQDKLSYSKQTLSSQIGLCQFFWFFNDFYKKKNGARVKEKKTH